VNLDPVLQQLLSSVPLNVQTPVDWAAIRTAGTALLPFIVGQRPLPSVAAVESIALPGEGGHVDVRVYRPTQPAQLTLIYIHGGGWTAGELDQVDHTIRKLCHDLPALVVSCTYRLAPEHPFPAGYDDALAAVRWTLRNIDELGGPRESIIIAGDSAGGNLAAAVTIALRDEAAAARRDALSPLPAITGQLLLYPAVDLRDALFASESSMADLDPTLRKAMVEECRAAYLQGQSPDDWRISPVVADLAELPPALVVVLSVDPLRDSGADYAAKLRAAGVRAELIEYSHLTHGFVHLSAIVPAAQAAFDEVIARCRMLARSASAGGTIEEATGNVSEQGR